MYAQLACFEGCQSSLGLVQAKAQLSTFFRIFFFVQRLCLLPYALLLCPDVALVSVPGVPQVGHNGANLAIKAGFHCVKVPGRDLVNGNGLVLQGSQ